MRISQLTAIFGLAAVLTACGHSGGQAPGPVTDRQSEPERRLSADESRGQSGAVRVSIRPLERPDRTPPVVFSEISQPAAPVVNDVLNIHIAESEQPIIASDIPVLSTAESTSTALPDIAQGPEPGALAKDGTVFAGNMPDTNAPLFVTFVDTHARNNRGVDVTPRFEWQEAMEFCESLEHAGHSDWSLPTLEQADVILQNRDKGYLADSFYEESTANDPGFYWLANVGDGLTAKGSEVDASSYAMTYRFSDGLAAWSLKEQEHRQDTRARARCVRLG